MRTRKLLLATTVLAAGITAGINCGGRRYANTKSPSYDAGMNPADATGDAPTTAGDAGSPQPPTESP